MRFELYTRGQELTAAVWKSTIEKITRRVEYFGHCTFEVWIGVNEIRFFLEAKKDFTAYANELQPFIITPHEDPDPVPLKAKFCYVDFSSKENIIRLKEREALRKDRTLRVIRWNFYRTPLNALSRLSIYFTDKDKTVYRCRRWFFRPRFHFLAIDFAKSQQYKPKAVPDYVNLQKTMPLFTDDARGAIARVMGFPYFHTNKYIPLQRLGYDRHSLIMGQTGTGKSKFLTRLMQEFERQGYAETHTMVVLDPHAVLYTDFSDDAAHANVDFVHTACQLFAQLGEPGIAAELTILLFKSIIKDQFNPKMERVLKYTLFSLFTANAMSLSALQKFLTDIGFRKEVLLHEKINDSIRQFFDTEFTELQTKYYELSIMPILGLLDELTFLPISNFQDAASLADLIDQHSLVFLSLNRVSLGQKATKLIAGLLIQQIFLLAQSGKLKKKIAFVIDEVSTVQNEALAAILSEARKFGLSLTLSQQYLQQIDEPIIQSVLTNVSHYVLFKVSEEDAVMLANNLEFDFPEELLADQRDKAQYEKHLKMKMMTQLNPRECLLRIFNDGKFYPVVKARTMDV